LIVILSASEESGLPLKGFQAEILQAFGLQNDSFCLRRWNCLRM